MKALTQPTLNSRWKHWKNGKIYTVVGFALFCDVDHEERLLAIYTDEEGGQYARTWTEFHDHIPGGGRRFEEVV